MRPVRLVAQGFTAFRDRTEIDFEGVDFFALVGPTGSGKSSVIDAVCFALYGSVPRYEDRRLVAPVITVGASEAKVSLLFEVAGDRYQATRVVRRLRGGGANTREARLERVLDDRSEPLAGNADEVGAYVERLLGLTFDYFTRCVVLPQGEFARFLHDKPSDRQELLRSLLNIEIYARMGQRARQVADSARNAAGLRQTRLDQLAYATPDAETRARERVGSLELLLEELRAAEPGVAELDRLLGQHRADADAAVALVGLLDRIAVPGPVRAAAAGLRELDQAVVGTADTAARAESTRKELEALVQRQPELGDLENAERAHGELEKIVVRLSAAEATLASLRSRGEAARMTAEAAATRTAAARETLTQLRRAHSAADLAAHLAVGKPCPVCLAVVERMPDHRPPSDLAEAERALQAAEAAEKQGRAGAAAVAAEIAKAETTCAGLVERRQEEADRVRTHPDAEALTRTIATAREDRKRLDAARKEEDAARDRQRQARDRADAARSRLSEAWRTFEAQRDSVARLGPPGRQSDDLLEAWSALTGWAKDQRVQQEGVAETSRAAAERCLEQRGAVLDGLAASCAKRGVEVAEGAMLADMRERTVGAAAEARQELKALAEAIAEADRIRADIDRSIRESEVADLLAMHLKSTGFERWLVAEALDLLVEGASATLMSLSGGQYSLARDERNDFLVVDHRNADERRSAKTLSGGETFQASLALALALADQLSGLAAEGAAALESIFLDEGFGSLDPEALATVADTVEALGSDERMVGIVTHVRDLAERVPVRYEVTRSGRTSIVERRTA